MKTSLLTLVVVLAFLCPLAPLFGQEATVQTSVEETPNKKKEKYSYFNVDDYEQTTLFKWYFNQVVDVENNFNASLGVEKKITPFLSAELRAILSTGDGGLPLIGGDIRYYPRKRPGSKAKKDRVNNFSGNYLGFSVDYLNYDGYNYEIENRTSYMLRYGRQQKWGKWGFIDFAAMISYYELFGRNRVGIGLSVGGGLAYGKSKPVDDLSQSDDLNLDLLTWENVVYGIGSPGIQIDEFTMSIYATPFIEIPLGRYLSVRPSVDISYLRSAFSVSSNFNSLFADASLEFRKYMGIRKREQRGKVTAGFNGPYAGLKFTDLFNRNAGRNEERDRSWAESSYGFNPTLLAGWQQNASRNIQFDINAGVLYDPFDGNVVSFVMNGHVAWVIGSRRRGVLGRR